MKQNVEYQIIIGCNDSYSKDEYVKHDELSEVIIDFFKRKEVDFSLLKQEGGYLCDDGNFILENGVCVTIIGDNDEKIASLANAFKMFMNQEKVLVIKNKIVSEIV